MNSRTDTFIIDPTDEGKRLDTFVASKIESLTRSYIQKLIEEGLITIDGASAKSGTRTRSGWLWK